MTTLAVNTEQLIAAIKRVLPHVAKASAGVPVLENIRFKTIGEHLVLSATDRYTAIESRVQLSEVDQQTPVEFLASGAQLKALLAALKMNVLTLITAPADDGPVEFNGSKVYGLGDGEYPSVDRLWPDSFEHVAPDVIALGVDQLKKMTALPQGRADKGTPMVFGHPRNAESRKPLVILFGDHTRVLVMPHRSLPTITAESWGMTSEIAGSTGLKAA